MTEAVIGCWKELNSEGLGILILRVVAVGHFVGWEGGIEFIWPMSEPPAYPFVNKAMTPRVL
jgi:hypothetical protein